MSKAAELTREELVERLAKAINASDTSAGYPAWLMLVGSEREYYISRVNAILAELKALGLRVVPEVPTERMVSEGESAASFGIGRPTSDDAIPKVWGWMLNASPFAGN